MATAEQSELQPPPIQRRILLSFCATVLAGLLLFVAYLSVRTTGSAGSRRDHPAEVPPPRATPAPAASVIQPRAPAIPRSEQPIPGKTYLQLAALDQDRAEIFVETLARNGFRAILASGPMEGIYRILVGPFEDAETLARNQADLQALGYTPFPRKHPAQ